MDIRPSNNDIATLVLQHQVRPSGRRDYESWLKQVAREGQRVPGHLGANVIRPSGASGPYTIVVRFNSHDSLSDWMASAVRKRLLDEAQPFLDAPEAHELHTGLEYWFTPDSPKAARPKPFKQFLVSLSAIYPLIVVVPWALQPLFAAVPQFGHPLVIRFVTAVIVVLLMVYIIMPPYTRRVAAWLSR